MKGNVMYDLTKEDSTGIQGQGLALKGILEMDRRRATGRKPSAGSTVLKQKNRQEKLRELCQ
jgi:hypothetical protein